MKKVIPDYQDHDRFMKRAIDLAIEHSKKGDCGPFGAVVAKAGKRIGEGWNQVVQSHDPSAHAEVVAIRSACAALATHKLDGCVIYCSCEPCPMCLSAIYWSGIREVFFAAPKDVAAEAGFDDVWILNELRKEWSAREIDCIHLPGSNASEPFDRWLENPNHQSY